MHQMNGPWWLTLHPLAGVVISPVTVMIAEQSSLAVGGVNDFTLRSAGHCSDTGSSCEGKVGPSWSRTVMYA